MAKCIICAGVNTNKIIDNIKDDSIELLGCDYTRDLDKMIESIGRLHKLIIFESGISDNIIPKNITGDSFETVFVINNKALLQKLDIQFIKYPNIHLLDNENRKITYVFIKDIISDFSKVSYMKFKNDNIIFNNENSNDNDEEEPEDSEVSIHINKEEEDTPVLLTNSTVDFTETQLDIPIKVSLEKEEKLSQNTFNPIEKTKDKLKRILSYYNEGCILLFSGLPKSYTSTTIWKIAQYIAKQDLTVGIIDLDLISCSFSLLDSKLYKNIRNNINPQNSLEGALKANDMISHSILADTNILLLTSELLNNSLDLTDSYKNMLENLIKKERKSFDVLLLDLPFNYFLTNQYIVNLASKLIFNIKLDNKELLHIMRCFELSPPELKKQLFDKSCYIAIDDTKKKLLQTNSNDISAIDNFLAKHDIINDENKYADIKRVGTILTDPKHNDFLENPSKYNEKEIENIILKVLN